MAEGQLGNLDHQNVRLGKAGRSRYVGWRRPVRGRAMNRGAPAGRGGGAQRRAASCSPWGKLAKGGRTRSPRSRVPESPDSTSPHNEVIWAGSCGGSGKAVS